jgi:DNA (cytosine-5)-methyltransferase 1
MTSLELFAGAGGAALGIRNAGVTALACVEWDADAAATLRANGFPAVHGDVRDVNYGDLPHVDLLWASPPCQAWSGLGKRKGAEDERNGWPWTLDVAAKVRPTWVVCENVPGSRAYIEAHVLPRLRELYAFVDVWHLDAADYGVASHRSRLFVVAGPRPVKPPKGTTATTVSAVLPHLRDEGLAYFAHECNAGWGLARVPHNLDQPCHAITAGSEKSHGGNGLLFVRSEAEEGKVLVPGSKLHRRASVSECAALMGFPAAHIFTGNTTSRRRQVGNAVPPPLAEAVIRAVRGG